MYMYSRIVNETVTTYEPQILEISNFFRQQVEIFVKSSVRGSLACTSVGIMPMTSLCVWVRPFWKWGCDCLRECSGEFRSRVTIYPRRAFAERIPPFQKWLNPNTQRRHRHNATDVQASDPCTDDFTKISTCRR